MIITREKSKGGRPSVITDDNKQKFIELYNAGFSMNDISCQLNISVPTLYRLLKKLRDCDISE